MRHLRRLYLVTLLLAVLSAPGNAMAEEPSDIAAILQHAIDTRDAALAEAHLDFDKMLEHFYATGLPVINRASDSGRITLYQPLPMLLASINSNKPATRASVRGLLSSETRKFTLYGIQTGSFAGNPLPLSQTAAMDGGLFASFGGVSTDRKEFSPAKLISRGENEAKVATTLFDHGSGRGYDLELALEKRGSYWVVTAVDNAEALANTLIEEAGQRRQ